MDNSLHNLVDRAIDQARDQSGSGVDSRTIGRMFAFFGANYGNLFTSKFASGERDANGKDKGIRNAAIVWGASLAKYPPEILEKASKKAVDQFTQYPPNLPQVRAICEALMPPKTFFGGNEAKRLPPAACIASSAVDFVRKNDGRDWARKAVAVKMSGGVVSSYTLRKARECLGDDL